MFNGVSEYGFYMDIEVFPPGCRDPVPDLPIRNMVVGSYRDRIIACGGTNITSEEIEGDNFSGYLSLDCFQLSDENTWQNIAPLNLARTQFYSVMVEAGDYLVAIFNPYNGLTTIEVYDGENWTIRDDLNLDLESIPDTFDVASGDFIKSDDMKLMYVMKDAIYTLDLESSKWSRQDIFDSINDEESVMGAQVLPLGDGLIRTGGSNFIQSSNITKFINIEKESNTWESFPAMSVPRFGHAMAIIDGALTVFGGAELSMFSVLPAYASTERFVGGEWVDGQTMLKARLWHSVFVVPCL